jgi:hypothetical protein
MWQAEAESSPHASKILNQRLLFLRLIISPSSFLLPPSPACISRVEFNLEKPSRVHAPGPPIGMKTLRIFSDRIRYRIRLERFTSVRIRVRIFNIWYRIHIRIRKSYIYDVDSNCILSGIIDIIHVRIRIRPKIWNKYDISDIRPYPIRFHP